MNKIILGDNLYELSVEGISNIDPSSTKENLIIVPDRFSLLAELLLFDVKKISCTFNTFVMPISKFCISQLSKITNLDVVDSQKQKFLIRRAVNLCKKKFKCFKNLSSSLIDEISKTISQLKSCRVKSGDFSFESSKTLENKLYDLNLIFEKYEELLAGKLDNNEILNLFLSKIEQMNLENFNFYFVGFDSFTTQICLIVKTLMKYGNVCVGIPFTKTKNRFFELEMYEMFKTEIECGDVNVEYAGNFLSKNQKDLLKSLTCKNEIVGSNYLSIFETESVKAEIDFVLMDICDKVRHGYKFNDFAIACSSLEKYEPLIENRICDFDINYYFDSSKSITKMPLHNFVLAFLNVFKNNFLKEDIFDFIKNQFLDLNLTQKSQIITLFNKLQLFEEGFISNRKFLTEEQFELTKYIFFILDSYEKKFSSCKIVFDFIKVVKDFLLELKIEEKLEKISLKLKLKGDFKNEKLFEQIYEKTMTTLCSIEDLGSESCDIAEFIEIFVDAFSDVKLSTVPISNNCVYIGDCTDSFFKKVKVLYVLGATANALPRIIKDCGLLLDDDIEQLNCRLVISPTIKTINKRNRFKLINTILSATDKLIVTYPIFDDEEQQILCSFIDEICSKSNLKIINLNEYLFIPNQTYALEHILYTCPNKKLLKEKLFLESKTNKLSKLQLSSIFETIKDEITISEYKRFNFKNDKTNLNNAKQLFFTNNFTKVSQLEDYFLCPYRHFLNYGLKLNQQQIGVGNIEIGNLSHKIAYLFAKNIKKMQSFEDCEDFVEKIFSEKKLKEFIPFLLSKQYDMLLVYLKYELKNFVKSIFIQQQSSMFKIQEQDLESNVFVEKYFNNEIGLKGVVDRIDSFKNDFIVIDYKSSNVNFNIASIYCGEKIQVLVYAGVLEYLKNKNAVGVFYLPVKNDDVKYHKFVGFFVKEEKIALALDSTISIDKSSSEFFNLKLSKSKKNLEKGEVVLASTVSSSKNLKSMIKYSKKLCEKAIEEILSGYISCYPLKNSCNFCEFKGACDFNFNAGNRTRTINFELKDFFEEDENE